VSVSSRFGADNLDVRLVFKRQAILYLFFTRMNSFYHQFIGSFISSNITKNKTITTTSPLNVFRCIPFKLPSVPHFALSLFFFDVHLFSVF